MTANNITIAFVCILSCGLVVQGVALHNLYRKLQGIQFSNWESYLDSASATLRRLRKLRAVLLLKELSTIDPAMSGAVKKLHDCIDREIETSESYLETMIHSSDKEWCSKPISWTSFPDVGLEIEELLKFSSTSNMLLAPETKVIKRVYSHETPFSIEDINELKGDLPIEEITPILTGIEVQIKHIQNELSKISESPDQITALKESYAWLLHTKQWWVSQRKIQYQNQLLETADGASEDMATAQGEKARSTWQELNRVREENKKLQKDMISLAADNKQLIRMVKDQDSSAG